MPDGKDQIQGIDFHKKLDLWKSLRIEKLDSVPLITTTQLKWKFTFILRAEFKGVFHSHSILMMSRLTIIS